VGLLTALNTGQRKMLMSDFSVKLQGLENLIAKISVTKMLQDNSAFSYTVFYEKDQTNYLAELCDKYGSDKGEIKPTGHPYRWRSHTYADFMCSRFGHCRAMVERVFECGIGTNNPSLTGNMGSQGKPGASLRVWRDYFPNAMIFGADIDSTILFEEERIKTFYFDQTAKTSIAQLWQKIGVSDFQLMIDDGLHRFEAGICLFENSISKLADNGYYIIEDVLPYDMLRYKSYFSQTKLKVEYVQLYRPGIPLGDNQLVVISR
jgi:hypothetical protein